MLQSCVASEWLLKLQSRVHKVVMLQSRDASEWQVMLQSRDAQSRVASEWLLKLQNRVASDVWKMWIADGVVG